MNENNFYEEYEEYVNRVREIKNAMSPEVKKAIIDDLTTMQKYLSSGMLNAMNEMKPIVKQYENFYRSVADMAQTIKLLYPIEGINAHIQQLNILKDYNLLYYYPDNMANKAIEEDEKANNKVVEEIFKPESDNRTDQNTIITLSPVNDKVLKYLSENPQALYQLGNREFEVVMAEIYSKLGYNVELTKSTRDGGKDIIIRKPDILGDFIYYVECKKYSPKKAIGVGIVRNLVGTINTDKVNGGILATTSFFSSDAKKFIIDNKYGYQIQMHDYDIINKLLNQVI